MTTVDDPVPAGYRTLFGHPVVDASAIETVIDRAARTGRIPADLDHPHYSTAGHFPQCVGKAGDRYVFLLKDFDRTPRYLLVREEHLRDPVTLASRVTRASRGA